MTPPTPSSLEPDYVSPAEFAARSSFSLPTVRRCLANGLLPYVQLGGCRCRIGIPLSALHAHLRTTQSPSEGEPIKSANTSRNTGEANVRRPSWFKHRKRD
jgi:hypothetical protein